MANPSHQWTSAAVKKLLESHSTYWPAQLEHHPEDMDWLFESGFESLHTIGILKASWGRKISWKDMKSDDVFAALRDVKRKEMLRITVRDLTKTASLQETVAELSALADFCMQKGLETILNELSSKFGKPNAQFAIFGLGKLGGQELNYSSDIDIIFVYSEEGNVGNLTHHDFYTRVAERFMKEFRGAGQSAALFRVDLRLRPEGDSGPITRSLESYENYYAAFGEVWERMALQKSRFIAGDAELGYEFIQHLQPFCFPKSLPSTALDEIFVIKQRIEGEILKEGGLERHVKLGRGGIREIEFSIQALQLLHGARHAFSQETGTLKSIEALHRLELLTSSDATALTRAYVFLRMLEHRLQMKEDLQTHTVPEDIKSQTAIAKGLGYASHPEFEKEWKAHIEYVRKFFHDIVRPGKGSSSANLQFLPEWDKVTEARDSFLKRAGFKDYEKVSRTLHALSHGPEYAHVSQRTHRLFEQLCPLIFKYTPALARPDFALEQLERFIEAYGSRASLYELLTSNPKLLELVLKLFDHSRFLADVIVRKPALLEAIAYEGLLGVRRSEKEMREALEKEEEDDLERKLRWFKRSELLRIEVRDILGLAASQQETYQEISNLAQVCLQAAVDHLVRRQAVSKKSGQDSFCVIAMGKFGGGELSYGSDLDILFIGNSSELASQVLSFMSKETADGIVFKMDARLRPDGADAPLTLSLDAYKKYYEKRAQYWEKFALTKARYVAGNPLLGQSFTKFVDNLIYSGPITGEEVSQMVDMRERIENERGDQQDPIRDFKTGEGGLIDVEFLAQIVQLQHGFKHPELRRVSTVQVLEIASKLGLLPEKASNELIKGYLWVRRLESSLRRFHNSAVSQLPTSRDEWKVIAKHLGLKDGEELESHILLNRKSIRSCFQQFISGSTAKKGKVKTLSKPVKKTK